MAVVLLLTLSPFAAFAATPSFASTFALYQGPTAPVGVVVDSSGTVYWTNYDTGQLLSLAKGATSPTVLLSGLSHPAGVAVDSSGNIYYDESFSQNVSELATGSTTPKVLFNAGGYATFMALDSNGNIYVVEGPATCNGQHGGASSIVKFDRTSQTVSTVISDSGGIGGVFVTSSGDLYYTTCAGTVDEVPNGSSTALLIVNGLTPSTGVAVDTQGDIFYTQYSSGVYMLPAGSSTSTVIATEGGTHYGLVLDDLGNVYYSDNLGGTIWEAPVSTTGTTSSTITSSTTSSTTTTPSTSTSSSTLPSSTTSATTSTTATQYGTAQAVVTGQSAPVGVTVDSSGNLYWVNWGSGQLLSLALGGSSSPKVLLTGLSSPQGLGIDSAGNLYFTEYNGGTLDELKAGSSARTVIASGLNAPNFLAVTSAGDVYFITGDTCGNTIMKYDHTTGTVSTILTRNMDTGHGFGGVFVDSSGNVYYTTCQSESVEVLPAGSSTTQVLASGIPYASGIAGDSSGNLFIDSYYSGVYMLPKGSTNPIEITAQNTAHELIAMDNLGDIFFSDNTGGKIWEVSIAQTLRGTSATQGQINQFVANGTIPVIIGVGITTANLTTSTSAFTVSLTPGNGSLKIVIGAQGVSGPRVLLLNITRDSFLNVQSGYLRVLLDNASVPEATSLEAVLTGSHAPSYVLIGTSSGVELLVSIAHFSTHTIVITTPAKSLQVVTTSNTASASGSGIQTPYVIGSIVLVAVVVTAMVFAIRSQRNRRMGSTGPSEHTGLAAEPKVNQPKVAAGDSGIVPQSQANPGQAQYEEKRTGEKGLKFSRPTGFIGHSLKDWADERLPKCPLCESTDPRWEFAEVWSWIIPRLNRVHYRCQSCLGTLSIAQGAVAARKSLMFVGWRPLLSETLKIESVGKNQTLQSLVGEEHPLATFQNWANQTEGAK